MTEEIKELLSIVSEGQDSIQRQQLLNYITNLQKENEKLKETLQTDRLMKAFMVEHNRNEKAVEYIKENTDKLKTTRIPKIDFNYNELLNILKGGDE